MKDVLIVSEDPVGIIKLLLNGITSFTNYTYDYIDHYEIRNSFRYKNVIHRTHNFLLKNISGRNLKYEFYDEAVAATIKKLQPAYKKILVIRPDLLTNNHLQLLRKRTDCFIAYYWDSVSFFPRKQEIAGIFDAVFSFDPVDCKQYGYQFQSNFYYYEPEKSDIQYQTYNLSSMDKRKAVIEKIALWLKQHQISFLFKGYSDEKFKNRLIHHTYKISYQQMIEEVRKCNVVLDVTKKGQNGLTLRPFEALGLNKKLITTNTDIVNYDFYHPANVWIIDPEEMALDIGFFDRPYKEIPECIKQKHHISQWLKNVLG